MSSRLSIFRHSVFSVSSLPPSPREGLVNLFIESVVSWHLCNLRIEICQRPKLLPNTVIISSLSLRSKPLCYSHGSIPCPSRCQASSFRERWPPRGQVSFFSFHPLPIFDATDRSMSRLMRDSSPGIWRKLFCSQVALSLAYLTPVISTFLLCHDFQMTNNSINSIRMS